MKGEKKTIQMISSEIAVRLFERQGKNNTILSIKKGGKGRVRIEEKRRRIRREEESKRRGMKEGNKER